MSIDGIQRADFQTHFDLDGDGTASEAERDIAGRLFDAMQAPDEAEDRELLESYEVGDFFDDPLHAAEVLDGLRSRAHRSLGAAAAALSEPGKVLDAVVDAKAEAVARRVLEKRSTGAVQDLEQMIAYLETLDGYAYAGTSVSGEPDTVGSDAIDFLEWVAEEARQGRSADISAEDIVDYAREYSLPGLAGLAVRAQWRLDDMRAQLETLPAIDEVIKSWIDDRDLDDEYDRLELFAEIDEYVRILGAMDDAIVAFPAMRRDAKGLEKLLLEVLIDQGAVDFVETGREPLMQAAQHYRAVIEAMAERYDLSADWVSDRLAAMGRLSVEPAELIPIKSLQPIGFPKR